jgi:hypothetical protein
MRAANAFNARDCKEGAHQAAAQLPEFRKLARAVSSASKAWIDPSRSAIDRNVAHTARS